MSPTAWASPAEEELQDSLTFEEWLALDKEATFMFTVNNHALSGRGILPGDTILFERGTDIANHDLVIARVDGSLVLRIYKKIGNSIQLISANKNFPVIQPQTSLIIVGKVKTVIRKY